MGISKTRFFRRLRRPKISVFPLEITILESKNPFFSAAYGGSKRLFCLQKPSFLDFETPKFSPPGTKKNCKFSRKSRKKHCPKSPKCVFSFWRQFRFFSLRFPDFLATNGRSTGTFFSSDGALTQFQHNQIQPKKFSYTAKPCHLNFQFGFF